MGKQECPKCGSTELTPKALYDEESLDGYECDSCGHTAMDTNFEKETIWDSLSPEDKKLFDQANFLSERDILRIEEKVIKDIHNRIIERLKKIRGE